MDFVAKKKLISEKKLATKPLVGKGKRKLRRKLSKFDYLYTQKKIGNFRTYFLY